MRARRRCQSTWNRAGRLGATATAKLAEVQCIKAQEVVHVRYRAVAEYPTDVELQAVLQGAQGAACQELPMCDCGSKLDE